MSDQADRKRIATCTLLLYGVTVGAAAGVSLAGHGDYVALILLVGAIVGSYLPLNLPPMKHSQTLRSALDGIIASVVLLVPYIGLLYLLRQLGVFSFDAQFPPSFWKVAAVQLIVVSLPEEFFFRATVQAGLDEVFLPKWRIFGFKFGWGLILAAVLFGLAHVTYQGAFGLTTAAPALMFGLLYGRRHNVAGAAIFHACCNLVMICFPAFSHRTFS